MSDEMGGRDRVIACLRFEGPDRLPYDLPGEWGSDFAFTAMTPSPDERPREGVDEWGAVWKNIGASNLGEVAEFPIKDWDDLETMTLPDIRDPKRWSLMPSAREKAGDKFLIGYAISIYERVHFLRGLENTWMDIIAEPENLGRLIDLLVEMDLYVIDRYAAAGVDGIFMADDWGLQNRLMISPEQWREIWKPRYARIYQAARDAGMYTFLHSCGYIIDILDDLIEIGLDVIQMDQQENMGLELLGQRFGGRVNFFSPVDIQNTMITGSLDDIRAYCGKMVEHLATDKGGFIPRWYTDPVGAGHRPEALDAMCGEFVRVSEQWGTGKARLAD